MSNLLRVRKFKETINAKREAKLKRKALYKLNKAERKIERLKLENIDLLEKVKIGEQVIYQINEKRRDARFRKSEN
jgi:hypothetical protein